MAAPRTVSFGIRLPASVKRDLDRAAGAAASRPGTYAAQLIRLALRDKDQLSAARAATNPPSDVDDDDLAADLRIVRGWFPPDDTDPEAAVNWMAAKSHVRTIHRGGAAAVRATAELVDMVRRRDQRSELAAMFRGMVAERTAHGRPSNGTRSI
jgi:hypothetical protein